MGRSPCCDKSGLKKGPWMPDEDAKLVRYIQMQGPGNWRALPKNAGLERCGKSCRLRWTNYLRPDIKRGRFSFEEEEAIIQLHRVLGNKWSAIASRLPGRTDNEIKNYWNTHIRKRLLKIGIDPVTHAPRLDQLDLSSLPTTPPTLNLLSNLLNLQSLLTRSEAIKLAMGLVSSQNENGQLVNPAHYQPQAYHQDPLQPNQFENITTQQIQTTPNLATPSFLITSRFMKEFPVGPVDPADPLFQDNLLTTVDTAISDHQSLSTNTDFSGFCSPDPVGAESSKNSSGGNNVGPSMGFDSVFSTPDMCSPAACLNLESGFVNGRMEDESESFCGNLLRFETQGGLEFDEFIVGYLSV